MVHQFIVLNAVTIKMDYPMRRIEPILNMMSQKKWMYFFKADAASGYWVVLLAVEHAYKTAFNTVMGQYYYLRIGQRFGARLGPIAISLKYRLHLTQLDEECQAQKAAAEAAGL